VAEVHLWGEGVVAVVGEFVTAHMPQHVWMQTEPETGRIPARSTSLAIQPS
jgi:hypothetical protein